MNALPDLDPVSGCPLEDVRYLDMIEEVHLLLDEAERLLQIGQRDKALYAMGRVSGMLDALS